MPSVLGGSSILSQLPIGIPGVIETPTIAQLLVIGTPGTTQITYFVTATNALGQDSIPSVGVTIPNAPNALSGANFVAIVINPVPGAVAYKVFKGNTSTFLASVGMGAGGAIIALDTGQATAAFVPSSLQPANWFNVVPIGSDHYIIAGPGSGGAGVVMTLTGVLGFTHSITKLKVYRFATALLTAAAAPVQVTTSNMGSLILPIPAEAAAQGTEYVDDWSPGLSPARGISQNTNTVVTCPATTAVIWTINGAFYFAS